MSRPFALRIMGAFALNNAATCESLLPPRRKARGLLAYLALSAERRVGRERLSALLWPDRPAEQARASLRQSIADLTRAVGGEPQLILPTRDDVSVNRDLLSIDRDDFLQAAQSGDLKAVEQRLAAWNGRILEDLDGLSESVDDWLTSLRRVTEVEIVNSALSAAEAGLQSADPQMLALIAMRLTAIDPFNERATRLGLAASAAAGDLAAVHRLFQRFEKLLRDELRTDPSAETRQLYLDLVGENSSRELQPSAARSSRAPAAPRIEAVGAVAAPTSRRRAWPIGVALLAALVVAGAGVWGARTLNGSASSPGPQTMAIYQAARDAANQRTRLGVFRAASLFDQVVRRSPNFSRGWSGRAFADFLVWSNPGVAADLKLRDEELTGRVQSSADRALALDPGNGEAYMVLALEAQERNDTATMDALIDRGLAVDPKESTLYRLKGANLMGDGYARAAARYLRQAVRLDPLDPRATSMLYNAVLESGATAEARQILASAYAKFPLYPHIWRARLVALIGEHRYPEAEAMVLPTALQPDRTFLGSPAQLRLIIEALQSGRPHLADAAISARGNEGDDSEAGYYVMRLALLGRLDEAFAAVKARQVRPVVPGQDESALRDQAGWVLESFIDPAFDRFREDRRFMELWVLDGTVAHWQKSGRWPDFCQRPHWPYDCEAVAARYVAEDSRFPRRS